MQGKRLLVCLSGLLYACSGPPPGAFSSAAPMSVPSYEGHAVTLGGRIYYLGGIAKGPIDPPCGVPTSSVGVFDPATGAWSAGPALPVAAPQSHFAIAVYAGKIYVLGGYSGLLGPNAMTAFVPNATTWSFDGTAFTRLADQPLARGGATAEALGNTIYVAGGGLGDEKTAYPALYSYVPAADSWTARAPMPTAREHVGSCSPDGRMIVFGGWHGPGKQVVASTEAYDPVADTWTVLPDMPTARGGLGVAMLGAVCYVIGGERWSNPAETFQANEGFDTATNRWSAYAPLPIARHGIGVAAFGNALYIMGGGPQPGASFTGEVDLFTP